MTQLLLLPACPLPSCSNLTDQAGLPCPECLALWGPYLGQHGEPSAWTPPLRPACGDGFLWWRRGRCDRCGCTEQVANR